MRRVRFGLSILLPFVFLLPASAQLRRPFHGHDSSDDTPPPTTTIRSTTRLVQVSVIVTDKKGEPITGLKKENFTLLDESRAQQIAFFSEPTPTPAAVKAVTLPKGVYTNRYDLRGQDPGAVTVVLFDLLNTSVQDQSRVRTQMIRFLKNLKPQDHVAMYGLTTKLYLLHEFTQDASALVEAANRLNPSESAEYDASHPQYFDVPALANDPSFQKFQAAVNEQLAGTAAQSAANRAQSTAAALIEIADHVATIPGRKNLVWLSGSFPAQLSPEALGIPGRDIRQLSGLAARAAEAMNHANMAIYPVDATGVVTNTSMDPQNPGNTATLKCMDCVNEAPGPSSGMFIRQNQRDTERIMAASTGGEAFYGSNDIVPAMKRAFDDGRYAYTIGFYPNHGEWNGKYRKIKVETSAQGTKLRYRVGYFATPEGTADQAQARQALQEAAASPLDATALAMIVSGKFSGPASERNVEFHVGLDPKQLLFQDVADHRKGEVDLFFVQRNAKGETLAAEDQRVGLDLEEKHYEYLATAGLVLARHVTLASDATELRVLARDTGSQAVGSVTIPVDALLKALENTTPTLKLDNLK